MSDLENDKPKFTFVDEFNTTERIFPKASLIGLHLRDGDDPVRSDHRVAMTSANARRLAYKLIEAADELEGVGKTVQ